MKNSGDDRSSSRAFRQISFTLIAVLGATNAHGGAPETMLHRFEGTPTDGTNPISLMAGSDGNLYGTSVGQLGINSGTVFRLTPGGVLTNVYVFDGTGGIGPQRLLEAPDGNFYGETYNGPSGSGTIFKLSPTGTLSTIYEFSALGGSNMNPDGALPVGGLIQASDGNFYGVTQSGGRYSDGVVFKLTPGGTQTVLHAFDRATPGQGAVPWGPLVEGRDGNLYGTTQLGGDYRYGLVFRVSTSGDYTSLFSFREPGVGSNNDGGSPLGGLIVGSDGNLYGTTSVGGGYRGSPGSEWGTVFRITPAGQMTVIYTFVNADDGAVPVAELSTRGDGVLYGVTNNGGLFNSGTVYRINEDGSGFVALYSFGETDYAPPDADGACAFAGVVPAADGSLYGTTEYGGHWIDDGCYGMGTAYKLTPSATLPSDTISVTPDSVVVGESATVTWTSANASECHGWYSLGTSGSVPLSGSVATSQSIAGLYPYYIMCSSPAGTAVAHVALTVRPAPPTLNFTIDRSTINSGQVATLTWSTSDATSCTASGDWSGNWAVQGSTGVAPSPAVTTTYSYTMTCDGPGGSVPRTVTLTVNVGGGSSGGGSGSGGGGGGGALELWWILAFGALLGLRGRLRDGDISRGVDGAGSCLSSPFLLRRQVIATAAALLKTRRH